MQYYIAQVKDATTLNWEFWEGSKLFSSIAKCEMHLIELISFMNLANDINEKASFLEDYRVISISSVAFT